VHRATLIFLFTAAAAPLSIPWATAQPLPPSFDLRSVNGGSQAWVSAIQDQGDAEDCWTFASATAMDSNLLKSGIFPSSPTPPPISISSWHLSTNNGAPDQLPAIEAFSANNSNWGGNMYQTLGYVTRGTGQWHIPNASHEQVASGPRYQQTMGGGPVLDSQNPLNPFPVSIANSGEYPAYLGPLVPPAGQTIPYRITAMAFYDQGFSNNVPLPQSTGNVTIQGSTYAAYTFDQGAADPQVAAIKNAMLSNGAVTTYMNADGDFHTVQGSPTNTIHYFNGKNATAYSDHSVTIIGWDDTYTMTDPKTNATATGAWLVQNSWGSTTWNNSDGTFWASYNDAVIGRSGVSTFVLADNSPYSTTVIQNELGPMDYSGNYYATVTGPPAGIGSVTGMAVRQENRAAGILTPAADGELLALGVVTQMADVLLNVEIYDSWNNGPGIFLGGGNFTLGDIGYFQLDLPQSLGLGASDEIVVQLTYLDPNSLAAVAGAMPVTIGGSGLNGYTDVTEGLSYYWDGTAWVDYASVHFEGYYDGTPNIDGGILFLKGITAVPEPSTILLAAFGTIVALALRRSKSAP
jgi:C1A family cysteine protease